MTNRHDDDDDDDHELNFLLIPTLNVKKKVMSILSHLHMPSGEGKNREGHTKSWLSDFNHLFIPTPRPPKKSTRIDKIHFRMDPWSKRQSRSDENSEPRFEILAAGSIKSPTAKTKAAAAAAGPSKAQDAGEAHPAGGRASEDNYMVKYQQNKQETQKAQAAKVKAENAAKAQGKETLKETMDRGRATQLFDQIQGWKSKAGTGEYDEATIQGNVNSLESEFYGIDEKYRPR
ncbi:MAG TPA: hypothetical protein DCY07_05170 [Rhodospirillaceae bacterium]|nr:hypothetical protein [Rhodospirillaceae bacterium]